MPKTCFAQVKAIRGKKLGIDVADPEVHVGTIPSHRLENDATVGDYLHLEVSYSGECVECEVVTAEEILNEAPDMDWEGTIEWANNLDI